LKNTQHKKRADGIAQVVESLPNIYKTLNSNPNTTKKMVVWKNNSFKALSLFWDKGFSWVFVFLSPEGPVTFCCSFLHSFTPSW
jgi:hypothetical protein